MANNTKRIIKKTFIKLLESQELSKITVKDIVQACDMNRNTFYYHFQDIPTLFEEIVKDIADKMFSRLPDHFSTTDVALYALKYVQLKKPIVYNIWHSSDRVYYEIHLMNICEYAVNKFVDRLAKKKSISVESASIISETLKCEFFGQIIQWIHHEMEYDLVQHAKPICKALEKIVEV